MCEDRISYLARQLAISELLREGGGLGESADEDPASEVALQSDAAPNRPDRLVALVDANLKQPPEVDPQDWRKARAIFLQQADITLKQVARHEIVPSVDALVTMEAVVVADGTRPSFLLSNGKVDPEDPFMGAWGGPLATADMNKIESLAGAVGRVQPEFGSASSYFGTGTLFDANAGLIITNFHVVAKAQSCGVEMERNGNRIYVKGHLEVDFLGESSSLETNIFRIREVLLPAGHGETFAGLDVAVCKLDQDSGGATLPTPVQVLSANPAYANGTMTSLAVIGFPAAPAKRDGSLVDWDFVLRTLFANKFGVKRLAPGRFTRPLGSYPQDRISRRAIGHDATTFGGASGALVSAWLDRKTPCFAIHFGGITESSNYALSFAAAREPLADMGLKFEP